MFILQQGGPQKRLLPGWSHSALLSIAAVTLAMWPSIGLATESPRPAPTPPPEEIDVAIDRGLAFLADRQQPDGHYPGQHGNTTAVPALAGMAFLSKGHTPGLGPYGSSINRSIDTVLAEEVVSGGRPSGYLTRNPGRGMYSHCIATLFLSEVSGMVDPERQKKIDEVLPRALAVILRAQEVNKPSHFAGGWRYSPTSRDADLSLTGWAVMALRSARLNGARVPKEAVDRAVSFIDRCEDVQRGGFAYQPGRPSNVAMSSLAMLCLSLSGRLDDDRFPKAAGLVLANRKNLGGHPEYARYYASQAMFQLGDDSWQRWSQTMYEEALASQDKNSGGWNAPSPDGYATSMWILALAVTYQQLPVYQRDLP